MIRGPEQVARLRHGLQPVGVVVGVGVTDTRAGIGCDVARSRPREAATVVLELHTQVGLSTKSLGRKGPSVKSVPID